ncbi:hypothetical protein PVAND_008273 [Polypedilum vanderplanki]|uniref:Centrosomal protein of 135 kDa n=1 Tax=Polypedilum vanderplanki TaxID=319348 RepID=A0A9J6C8Y5_POLVA|nr:hypothetical protein PVAND_008273 [Polypedilum vanderplanki]
MDFNIRHDYLKQKLDILGYSSHQLPISAIPLVSEILDDLIQTTESLKSNKDELNRLIEEKKAWELGNEVYKCDNSKLLQEVNRLKLELLNKEKSIQIENADLKRKIRNLSLDKKALEEKCFELNQAMYQINQSDRSKGKKSIKPFISTVRGKDQFPDISGDIKDKPCGCTSSVNANTKKSISITKEIEKIKSELKHAEDLIAILKKQEAEKEREIQRLSCLFVGGRPVNALAKDCCYKDVSKITEDISVLQREKIELTAKLTEYDDRHEKLFQKWKQQKEKIKNLESQLKEISDAALYVEREANLRIKNQKIHIEELKENLHKNGSSIPQEIKDLKRTVKEKIKQEQKHLFEIEYLKNKLKQFEQQSSSKNSELVTELIKERDLLQNKLEIIDNGNQNKNHEDNCNVHQIYTQLKEKEAEICRLQEMICDLKSNKMSHHHQHAGALTVTNSLRRVECERDCALGKAQELKMENDSLNDKIKVLQDSKINDTKRIIKLEENITKLKLEIKDLQESKNPAFNTIKQLREENCELQIKLRSSDEDYKKLNATYNQIKILSQQTENVLMNVQNQLEFTKCELTERESQICCLNKSIDCLKEQIEKYTNEISKLKNDKSTIEREKEFYAMTLDKRNEKLHSVESKMESAMCLKESNRTMRIKIDDLNCEIKRLESIVCDTRSENQCLCKQLETTKHHLTNAIHENGRMSDELAAITAELNATKKCLNDSQKESEIIKSKLQSYIHEIERIDGLIAMKDNDRKQTLCQYKDLECQFKSLDQESCESKRIISEYEEQIKILTGQLKAKDVDIESLEKQLIDISTEIDLIRSENMKLHVELEAQRNLCEKLDIQKEKQKAELIEYQLSCKELLEKNDKLREEILILREMGGGDTNTHVSGSYHPTM